MPDYYKWTQWLFIQFYKQGLAYKKNSNVNWCPSCATVLVVDGACERCESEVDQKSMDQWFFKITDYAQRLLDGIRNYALSEYGPVTKRVLSEWGINECIDFGHIVFNLVNEGLLGKTEEDTLADFSGGYNFSEAFEQPFLPSQPLACSLDAE